MSKANAKIPPVKITPVMKFNPNEDTLSGSRSSSSMDKSMDDFNVPKRQKTSIRIQYVYSSYKNSFGQTSLS